MPRNAIETYERFIEEAAHALGHDAPEAAIPELRRILKGKDPQRYACIAPILGSLSISASYVVSHLLSIPSWPQDVQDGLHDGLPLAKARAIAQADAAVRRDMIAAALDRPLKASEESTERKDLPLEGAWVPASGRRRTTASDNVRSQDTWIYPSLAIGKRAHEVLHPKLAKSILLAYTRAGDKVVDLTAGAGTIAYVAHELELSSWSGDLHPRAPFIHTCDARVPLEACGLRTGCADLVILHPPTFNTWCATNDLHGTSTFEAYQDFVEELVAGAGSLLPSGGHVVLVTRPVRTAGATVHSIGPLIQVIEDTFGVLHRHHVAIETMARKHWDVLVGLKADDE